MVRPLARAAATLILCALAAAGCFDARLRNPGPLIIDDFEDGNLDPELTTFDPWDCYAYNAADPTFTCGLAQGFPGSNYGLSLDFHVDDPVDGKQQHGGASLAVYDRATLDLGPYQDFVFSAKIASGKPALPSEARLYIELGCSTALAKDGSRPGNLYVVTSAPFKPDWETSHLDVASFGFPSWLINNVKGGTAPCLRLIDSIRFTVDMFLADGESGQGVLTIDDIHLE